jgi:hypothetical protein
MHRLASRFGEGYGPPRIALTGLPLCDPSVARLGRPAF